MCPKCKGKEAMEYKVWSSRKILADIRTKKITTQSSARPVDIIKITCSGCNGNGKLDWIQKMKGFKIWEPFAALEGNMEIYYIKAVNSWFPLSRKHRMFRNRPYKYPKDISKFIERTQERYIGIKLNSTVLDMSHDELFALEIKLTYYKVDLDCLPTLEVTEDRIREILTKRGLSEFMPDKFVHPGPDDLTQ
jgi:hypothetical protein